MPEMIKDTKFSDNSSRALDELSENLVSLIISGIAKSSQSFSNNLSFPAATIM